MAKSIADLLMERRAALINQAQEIAQKGVAEDRNLSVEEQTSFEQMITEAQSLEGRAKAIHEAEQRAADIESSFRKNQPEVQAPQGESAFGKWAREARVGDAFDLQRVAGAERRAVASRGAETRAMSATGGVAPDGVYGQLWQYAVNVSQLLQAGVDIMNTSDGNTLPLPVATVHATTGTANSLTPATVAANAAITANDATLTTVNLSVSKYGYLTLVPSELVQDTTFDLEGYIAKAAGRELGRTLSVIAANAAIAGFTTLGYQGAVGTTTTLGTQGTAGQGSIALTNLYHSVIPAYRPNAAWVMNDLSIAAIRNLLASTTGMPVWQSALTAGDPDLLYGRPVYAAPELPTMAASAKSIYFGEWDALKVRIAGGMRFERSDQYAFGNDQVAFRALIRAGAVTVDPNAVKFFQNSAT